MQASDICQRNFPIRNYTVVVDGVTGPTIMAVPTTSMVTGTITSSDIPFLVSDRMFQLSIMACSDITCRESVSVPLSE